MVPTKEIFCDGKKKFKPGDYNLWLMPLFVNGNHWVLVTVCFPLKIIVYFDSLHGNPNPQLIEQLRRLISKCRSSRHQKSRGWKGWKVFIPEQTPLQDAGDGNCGVYVCIYAYCIISQSGESFKATEMNRVRIGIAKFLNFYNNRPIDTAESEQAKYLWKDGEQEVLIPKGLQSPLESSRKIPFDFSSIFEFCKNLIVMMTEQ